MMAETENQIAIKYGWDHSRRGPWRCELKIRAGYKAVTDGVTEPGDLCMVMVPPFPKRFRRGREAKIKGKWEIIEAANIGLSVKGFHFICRKVNDGGKEQRRKRLKMFAHANILPFDLDFMRELGFEFGLDWDGQLLIESPESLSVEHLCGLIKQYSGGIKRRLYFEGENAKHVLVGGLLNGRKYDRGGFLNHPICYHIQRGVWAVYMVKSHDDPRAWFIGTATSKKKAKQLKGWKQKGE